MLYHGNTEIRSKLLHEDLTESVIGAAVEVHRALGLRVGLILNFNTSGLTRGGIVRKIL